VKEIMMLRKLSIVLAVVAIGLGSVPIEAFAHSSGRHGSGFGDGGRGGRGLIEHSGGSFGLAHAYRKSFRASRGSLRDAQRGLDNHGASGCNNSWPGHDDYSDNDGFTNSC
jgi:hypothetical protein